jgi:hypothetical protein
MGSAPVEARKIAPRNANASAARPRVVGCCPALLAQSFRTEIVSFATPTIIVDFHPAMMG